MKITDKELLDAIWTNQLRLLSKSVLDNYIGGSINVCGKSEFDYIHTSSEHRMRRENVTKKISFKHLSSRLQKLASSSRSSSSARLKASVSKDDTSPELLSNASDSADA